MDFRQIMIFNLFLILLAPVPTTQITENDIAEKDWKMYYGTTEGHTVFFKNGNYFQKLGGHIFQGTWELKDNRLYFKETHNGKEWHKYYLEIDQKTWKLKGTIEGPFFIIDKTKTKINDVKLYNPQRINK